MSQELGFLTKRNNPGNGQDKTYQYQLQVDAIASRLPEAAECKKEIPERRNEPSENTAEQRTQITSTDIQNTNITPVKKVCVEKSFPQEVEQLVEKYEKRLKGYGIYPFTKYAQNENEEHTKNPKFEPILQVLAKIPPDRAERSILAFLRWIKDAKNVEDKYKLLRAAIVHSWEVFS